MSPSILEPGRNGWRLERADRFRCVQDGAEFFRLAREAILAAERTIFVLGWDIWAGVDLLPGAESQAAPTRLVDLLEHVVERNPELRCYILVWDYAALYSLERDPFSRLRLSWGTSRRIHFRFDARHPFGASHHQKVIVVDDRLAFSGGLDLTGHRWDSPEHPVQDPRRVSPLGQAYPPFHDVQALVEGPVAASLGALARERWRRLGKRRLPPILPASKSLWPAGLAPDLEDVDVMISRTEPAYRGRPAVRECEALYLDAIAAARSTIYLENQYVTNARVGEALARRLAEPDGPEVVLLVPRSCSGWLDIQTMGALQPRVLGGLARADAHGRLRILHPIASAEHGIDTFIHSKILVVDDELLRIGSANLSNRSMGLDTECDVTVAANGDPRLRSGIARVRDRLVAEHVGRSGDDVGAAVAFAGSLRGAIDALSGGDRRLEPVEVCAETDAQPLPPVAWAIDPTEPMAVTRAVDGLLPEIEANERGRLSHVGVPLALALAGAGFLLLAAEGGVDLAEVRAVLGHAPGSWASLSLGLLLFVALSLAFVPVEVLVLAAVVGFGPLPGGAVTVLGVLLAGTVGHAAGKRLGLARLVPWIGRRAYGLWRELRSNGATSIAMMRLLSVTSPTAVHLLSGAARVPLREYWRGTWIGFAPKILVLGLLGGMLRRVLLHPGPIAVAVTTALCLVLALAVLRLRRSLLDERLAAARQDQEARARYG